MPHRTRHEKFERYFARYNIGEKLLREQARETTTPRGSTISVKEIVPRFETTANCIDFFNLQNKDLWLPEIEDPAKYLHGLNESETIKAAREHAITCGKCAITLDAFLLSQVQPSLFHGVMRDILAFETHQDKLKNIYVAGLPWPGHEVSTQTGRLVYVTRLPIQNGVWEFKGRVKDRLLVRGVNLNLSEFAYSIKHDGQRAPCYQANAHLPEKKGYVCIRSKANTKPVEKKD